MSIASSVAPVPTHDWQRSSTYRPDGWRECTSWQDATTQYDLDWDVRTEDVYDSTGRAIKGWQRLLRDDSGTTLAVSKKSYYPVPNAVFGQMVDAILETESGSVIDTVTVLNGGRGMIASIALAEPLTIPGDPSPMNPYINLSNSHDASLGVMSVPYLLRWWCSNMVKAVSRASRSSSFGVHLRHTRQMANHDDVVLAVQANIARARLEHNRYLELATALANQTVADLSVFEAAWLPMPDRADAARAHTMRDHKIAAFRTALDSPRSTGSRHNAWNVYQAAIEADQHTFPARTAATRALRTLEGGSQHSRRALDVVLALAA